MQSKNGPCPLLAIANVLILRGDLKIHKDHLTLQHSHLVSLVADKLLGLNKHVNHNQDEYNPIYANLQHNLSDAISHIPTLQRGMDVNVKFKE